MFDVVEIALMARVGISLAGPIRDVGVMRAYHACLF